MSADTRRAPAYLIPGDRILVDGVVRTVTSVVRRTRDVLVTHRHPRASVLHQTPDGGVTYSSPRDDLAFPPIVSTFDNGERVPLVIPQTWADGFGLWHVSVPMGNTRQAEATQARRAILAELTAREANHRAVRLRVTRERETLHGTVVYREV